jgi:hypothetical protein
MQMRTMKAFFFLKEEKSRSRIGGIGARRIGQSDGAQVGTEAEDDTSADTCR